MVDQILTQNAADLQTALDATDDGNLDLAAANPEILGNDTDGVLIVGPSSTNILGAILKLYGDTHATKADDVEILNAAVVQMSLDASASQWNMGPNDLVVANGQGILIGHPTQLAAGGSTPEVQVLGTSGADSRVLIGRFSADTTEAAIDGIKSRAAIGAQAIVVTGDNLLSINAYGDDGVDYLTKSSAIFFDTEGTIGANRIPGLLKLQTSTDAGPGVMTTALTINSAQLITAAAGLTVTTGDLTLTAGFLILNVASTLTIAGGVVTATESSHLIGTQGGAGTDDLDTINGVIDGALLHIRPASGANDVVAKDGTGNLALGGDFTMDANVDSLFLRYEAALATWIEVSRSNNG